MKIEDLKNLGIEDDDLLKSIFALHGKSIEKLKGDHATAIAERDQIQAQLEEATKAIEGFKEMDIDGIKTAAAEWQTKAEQAQLEAENKVKALQFDHKLETALRDAKAKNPKAVKALLKMESLSLDESGEKIEGLDDQLDSIFEENDYLFDSDEEMPHIVTGGKSGKITPDAVAGAARQAAGLENIYE